MNAGKLNTKITFNTIGDPPVTVNDDGQEVDNLVPYKTVWANKTGLTGNSFYQAKAVQLESSVIFNIRYATWITPNMVITDKSGNIYYPIGDPIDKTGNRQELYIHASTVKPR